MSGRTAPRGMPAAAVAPAIAAAAAGSGLIALLPLFRFPAYQVLLAGILAATILLKVRTGPFLFLVVALGIPLWRLARWGRWRPEWAVPAEAITGPYWISIALLAAVFLDASHRYLFRTAGFDPKGGGFSPTAPEPAAAEAGRALGGILGAAAIALLAAHALARAGVRLGDAAALPLSCAILGAVGLGAFAMAAFQSIARTASLTSLEARALLQQVLWTSLFRERWFLSRMLRRMRRRRAKRETRRARKRAAGGRIGGSVAGPRPGAPNPRTVDSRP